VREPPLSYLLQCVLRASIINSMLRSLQSSPTERNVGVSGSGRSGSSQPGPPVSATPSRTSLGFKRSVSTAEHTRYQQLPQPSPRSSVTSLLREDCPAPYPDVLSRHDRDARRVDDPRETPKRSSDCRVELNPLKSLSPTLLPTASNRLKASSSCNLTVSRSSTALRKSGTAINTQPIQNEYHPPMPWQSQTMVAVQPSPHPGLTTQKSNQSEYPWPNTGGRTLGEASPNPQPARGRAFCGCTK
jgi:hypothetical protein